MDEDEVGGLRRAFTWAGGLDFDENEEKAYCFYCIKSIKDGLSHRNKSVSKAYTHNGFNAWKKVPKSFREHESSKEHQDAFLMVEKLLCTIFKPCATLCEDWHNDKP